MFGEEILLFNDELRHFGTCGCRYLYQVNAGSKVGSAEAGAVGEIYSRHLYAAEREDACCGVALSYG